MIADHFTSKLIIAPDRKPPKDCDEKKRRSCRLVHLPEPWPHPWAQTRQYSVYGLKDLNVRF